MMVARQVPPASCLAQAAATIVPLPMKSPATRPAAPRQPKADPLDTPALGDSLRALARRGVVRSYRRGTLLIQEGDQGDALYIILDGKLRAFGTGTNGREFTYGTYGPGEYLGEMSLDGGPRAASVECLQPCTCAVVTRPTLMAHIGEYPEFAFELLAKVIRRARAATLSAKQMAVNDVYGRLRANLEQLAGPPDPQGVRWIDPAPTHQDLSRMLGCSREMISRLLKDLSSGGYMLAEQRRWCIVRPLPARW
jgi:CRP/FNR family cyclic AMP-dependent transcriptional regulator